MISERSIACDVNARAGEDLENLIFGEAGPPRRIEYWEAIDVGFYVCGAPPGLKTVYLYGEPVETECRRPSEFLARRLLPQFTSPALNRKLLLVMFKGDDDDGRRTERLDQEIRKALGYHHTRVVWQGRDVRAYCFTHHSKCKDVGERLHPVLGNRNILDFLIVEPLALTHTSQALSPLGDWISNDHKRMGAATFPVQRRDRAERVITAAVCSSPRSKKRRARRLNSASASSQSPW